MYTLILVYILHSDSCSACAMHVYILHQIGKPCSKAHSRALRSRPRTPAPARTHALACTKPQVFVMYCTQAAVGGNGMVPILIYFFQLINFYIGPVGLSKIAQVHAEIV